MQPPEDLTGSPSRTWLIVAVSFALLAVILTMVAPEEATLGWVVKIVYLHLAVIWTALGLFATMSVLGLAFLAMGRPGLLALSSGAKKAGVLFYAIYVLLSLVAAQLAWGGVNWSEPRLMIAVRVMTISVVVLLIGMTLESARAQAMLNTGFGIAVFVLWMTRYDVLHPGSPVWRGESIAIKIFSSAILASALVAGVATAKLLAPTPGYRASAADA